MVETRKIAAILVADVVGYSRLAGVDKEGTLARLRALRSDLVDPAIAAHHGRTVKRTGWIAKTSNRYCHSSEPGVSRLG
jgi:adenylate cyclase